MISINAHDFCDYDEALFLEFLNIHEDTEFEISFSRRYFKENGSSVADDYDSSVGDDYFALAYAGQRLADIASSFSYLVHSAKSPGLSYFKVRVTNMQKLAKLLIPVIKAYYLIGPDKPNKLFYSKAQKFYVNAITTGAGCVTWGFVHLSYLEDHKPKNKKK